MTSKKHFPTFLILCSSSRCVGPVSPGTGIPQEMLVVSLLDYRSQPLQQLHLQIQLLLQLPWIFPNAGAWNCNGRGCPGSLLEQHPPAKEAHNINGVTTWHGRWCGLSYQTLLTGKIFKTVWVSLWSLTASPQKYISLVPKMKIVTRTHLSPGSALRAPTPVQQFLSDVQPLKTWDFLLPFQPSWRQGEVLIHSEHIARTGNSLREIKEVTYPYSFS